MNRKTSLLLCALLSTYMLVTLSRISAAETVPEVEELYRFRITNSEGAPVELSLDKGRGYITIGQVTKPAITAVASFGAASYVSVGTVAATAVHGLRIKAGQTENPGSAPTPMTLSIVPREFARIPKGYGGHEAGSSGIYTDIPAGTSIFRTFAPFAGSRVMTQRLNALQSIQDGYTPAKGDVLVVVVERPLKWPTWIEFENRPGGSVSVAYPDGSTDRVTSVLWPVSGVGRYDGTSYTGVGRINTNHGGVLTVSTAPVSDSPLPEGDGPERRGGFMVQPSFHAGTQGPRMNQVMIVGPENPSSTVLEGKPPLFLGYLGLADDAIDANNSYVAQVRIDGGEWEDMPEITGRVDEAFLPSQLSSILSKSGKQRQVKTGVTHFRIKFPRLDREFLQSQAEKVSGVYASAVLKAGGGKQVSGVVTINAVTRNSAPLSFVAVCVNGERVAMSNSVPYSYQWDTTQVADGAHTIEILGMDDAGSIITRKSTRVVVKNGKNTK